MAVYQTYQQVGIKEDISDIIVNISPTKTPFQSMIGNEKVWNTYFQWQEDILRAAAQNAQVEGFDASYITVTPTTMRNNYTQIFAESSQVSGTADVVQLHGRDRESAYQLAKSAAQVKRDLEFAYVGQDQAATVGTASGARLLASANEQIASSGTGQDYLGSNIFYSQSGSKLLETLTSGTAPGGLLQALEQCYVQGAEPNTVLVTPGNAVSVAGFAKSSNVRQRFIQDNGGGDDKRMVNAIDVYVSPYGEVKVVLDRFLKNTYDATGSGTNWTLVFDTEMWVKATLRPWTREVLAKTGDSIKQMIVGEFSLKHKNYQASALIVDNATSGY